MGKPHWPKACHHQNDPERKCTAVTAVKFPNATTPLVKISWMDYKEATTGFPKILRGGDNGWNRFQGMTGYQVPMHAYAVTILLEVRNFNQL